MSVDLLPRSADKNNVHDRGIDHRSSTDNAEPVENPQSHQPNDIRISAPPHGKSGNKPDSTTTICMLSMSTVSSINIPYATQVGEQYR